MLATGDREQRRRARGVPRRELPSVCETLTPIPQTTAPPAPRAARPATLRPSTRTSFGHLTPARGPPSPRPPPRPRAARRARAAALDVPGRPQEEREEQRRPGDVLPPPAARGPGPAVWCSVTATAPSGSPGRAEDVLRRGALSLPEVRPPEPAAEQRLDAIRRSTGRVGHAAATPRRAPRGRASRRAGGASPASRRSPTPASGASDAAPLDAERLGELRDEPLDGELAVPRLAALVLRDGAEHRPRRARRRAASGRR